MDPGGMHAVTVDILVQILGTVTIANYEAKIVYHCDPQGLSVFLSPGWVGVPVKWNWHGLGFGLSVSYWVNSHYRDCPFPSKARAVRWSVHFEVKKHYAFFSSVYASYIYRFSCPCPS